METQPIDRTTAPGHAPKVDRRGEELRPGDVVRWCIPATRWTGGVFTGTIFANRVLPTRVGDEWLATLSVETPDGQVWLLPTEAMERVEAS